MRERCIRPTITKKRIAWLQTLEDEGVANRNSLVGFHTMRLKWTQWAMKNGSEIIGLDEFDRRFPLGEPSDDKDPRWAARKEAYDTWTMCGEMLTEVGRRILTFNREILKEGEANADQKAHD